MADGDLTDLQGRVQDRGSFNTSDAGLTTTKIKTFINAALKQIANERDWPWLFTHETITTAVGTNTYSPAADWVRTDALIDTAIGEPLLERQALEIDQITAAGRPRLYAMTEEKLYLGPNPDAIYSLRHRYVRKEKVLSAGSDLPYLPTYFDDGIVEWTTILCFRFTGQYDKALTAADYYNTWLQSTQDNVNRSRRPRRVRVRPGLPI